MINIITHTHTHTNAHACIQTQAYTKVFVKLSLYQNKPQVLGNQWRLNSVCSWNGL